MKTPKITFCLLLVISISGICLSEAKGMHLADTGSCYAVLGQGEEFHLVNIDPSTGTYVNIGETGLLSFRAMDIDSRGNIFCSIGYSGSIYRLDASSGSAAEYLEIEIERVTSLAVDNSDMMYVLHYSALYRLDLATGESEFLAEGSSRKLAIDPVSGSLWGCDYDGNFFIIDKLSGVSSQVMSVKQPIMDFSFDAAGNLFVLMYQNEEPYIAVADKSSGDLQKISKLDPKSFYALAFHNVPYSGKHVSMVIDELDFGKKAVDGSSVTRQLSLGNAGTDTLTINSISNPDSIFTLKNIPSFPVMLAPGQHLDVDVSFTPNDSLLYADTIIISSDADNKPLIHLPLSGEGITVEPADPGFFYATALSDGIDFLRIDPASAKGTLIATQEEKFLIGIAIDTGGMIYALDYETGDLYQMDTRTGASVFKIKTGLAGIVAMAFDTANILYAASESAILYTIDMASGFFKPVGQLEIDGFISDMVFDPEAGLLWGVDEKNTVQIDTGSASLTWKFTTRDEYTGITLDPAGNLFLCSYDRSNGQSALSIMNRNEGEVHLVGEIGIPYAFSLASYNVPHKGKQLYLIPDSLNYGLKEIGKPDTIQIAFGNIGTEALNITALVAPDSIFEIVPAPSLPLSIQPGSSVFLHVVFSPRDTVSYSDSIQFLTDIEPDSAFSLELYGKGVEIMPATPGICYASSGSTDGGRLLSIDPLTGSGTLIGATGLQEVYSIAINSAGEMYCAEKYGGDLYRLDAGTGIAIFAASTGLYRIDALAFDSDDVLYATEHSSLFTINTETGLAGMIGSSLSVSGLTADSSGGDLWGILSYGPLYTIDKESGQYTYAGNTGFNELHTDIAFDVSGKLFALIGGYDQEYKLIRVDKAGGTASIIGNTGYKDIRGLAFYKKPRIGKHIQVDTDSLNFGSIETGGVSAREISISSYGSETVSIDSISFPDASFGFAKSMHFPLELASLSADTLEIVYKPTDEGSHAGNMIIYSDAADPLISISLTGKAYWVDTLARKALYLENEGDFMEVLNSPDLSPEEFTVEFWFRVHEAGLANDAGGEQNILDIRGYDGGYNFRLAGTYFPLNGHAILLPDEGMGSVSTDLIFEQNTWYHIAFKRKANGTLIIHVDGEIAASRSGTPYSSNTLANLRVGEYLGYTSRSLGFHGEIDDLRIWDHIRSKTMIKANMYEELSGTEEGLSAYWNFNYRIEDTIPGRSPNRNKGILYGNATLVDSDVPADLSVNVREETQMKQSYIYPNPFTEKTTLHFPNEESGVYCLKVRDMTGKTVRITENISGNSIELARDRLPAGIYLYELTGPKTYRGKFMLH